MDMILNRGENEKKASMILIDLQIALDILDHKILLNTSEQHVVQFSILTSQAEPFLFHWTICFRKQRAQTAKFIKDLYLDLYIFVI